ncbi:threonylcarbamoyladenosine tRNA methylthiotransferase MtaB [Halanaerobium sp. MA284_MarDTE_T2]|nr:threonylcarbamoyladenosine tRNA methylthiotransferase MtaB [Halanaerobium sp. MA284_MarDTE_T2]RCW82576.1 threonylcarbamoyladenosine tRNA methylthiotransferase MtaB [Halanaerobium sp. DL-01]
MIIMNKKAAFYTLGCRVNQYETEAMIDLFTDSGFEIVDYSKSADVYIINSCTVTNEAARKTRQIARRAKRANPNSLVGIVGCYTQAFPDEVESIDEIDFIMGSSGKLQIVNKVSELLAGDEFDAEIKDYKELNDYEGLEVKRLTNTTRANVKIEDGCNQFCTYCIIPYARGPVRSRSEKSVIEEVKNLCSQGVKEIILTGTHLGAYGSDKKNKDALAELIEKILDISDIKRIRLSSIEETEISDKLIALIAEEKRVCSHLHLPLQSGSDKILKAMNRPYLREDFIETVEKIRKLVPDIAITTDIIVGFPGENNESFSKTVEIVKEVEFSKIHVFPFSIREGTKAAEMKNKLPGDIISAYSKKLRDVNEELMLKYQRKFINKVKEVLVEEERDHRTGMLTGFTDNYLKVLFAGPDAAQNSLLKVRLTDSADPHHVKGELVD